jgi:tyrosyl-tRNA synthetase
MEMQKNTLREDIISILSGVEFIVGEDQLKKKLENNEILKIKLGADPTAPNLHLGHVVVLEKLRDFQKCGHNVIFLIGDFTAQIGDPTGKTKTRPPLSKEAIEKNVETYVSQITKILDKDKLAVVYNGSWFQYFKSEDWIKLTAKVTLAQITEREDFKKRIDEKIPVRMHELLYPLLQAYDSVELSADVEIGGTDQTFNLLLGRTLQEAYGKEKQIVITMPLIEGTDGKVKMSKSLGNEIGLTEEPYAVFGKIMSIPDSLVNKYFRVLLRYDEKAIEHLSSALAIENKKKLAFLILEKYWGKEAAESSLDYFVSVVQKKSFDHVDLQEIFLESNQMYTIFDLCAFVDTTFSRSHIRRLILEGAISLNKEKIMTDKYSLKMNPREEFVFKVGKYKFFKLKCV